MKMKALGLVVGLAMVAWTGCVAEVTEADDGGNGGSGNGGNGGQCQAYENQPGAADVTVRFVNQSGMDVYIPGNCDQPTYGITSVDGGDGNFVFGTSCLVTCADLQEDAYACAADACAPTVQRVADGEMVEVVWNGTMLDYAEMPTACYAEPFGGETTCPMIAAAPAQDYQVTVQTFSDCPDCECPLGSGTCFGEPGGVQGYPVYPTFSFPEQDVVEVLFDVCHFGCAVDGGEGPTD